MKPIEKGAYSEFHKVIATQDGNFISVGLVANGDTEDGWALKFSNSGEPIWYRAIDGNSTTDRFADVKETGYNEFMLFGTADDRPLIVTLKEKDDQVELVNLFLGY